MNKLMEKTKTVQMKMESLVKIDLKEAKTLKYCAKALKNSITSNLDNYLSQQQAFRTGLFKKLTYILNISYSVYKNYCINKKPSQDKNMDMPRLASIERKNINVNINMNQGSNT